MTTAIIEIPSGCMYKYEHDKDRNVLVLDRPLNQACPVNYGYLPNTLSEDGDPLDIFVFSKYPIISMAEVKIDIIGIIYCNDNGITDNKVISSLKDENFYKFTEMGLIYNYLKTYKTGFEYKSFGSKEDALNEITICKERYNSNL